MPVRVRPEGFLLGGKPPPLEELEGRMTRVMLLRKRFHERALICFSPDGMEGRDGTPCQQCLHPDCRPHLRVHLRSTAYLFVIDLGGRSAENLLQLEEEAEAEGRELVDFIFHLTVVNHGRWGEVCFERCRSL
jgi:hypothetical protein